MRCAPMSVSRSTHSCAYVRKPILLTPPLLFPLTINLVRVDLKAGREVPALSQHLRGRPRFPSPAWMIPTVTSSLFLVRLAVT